LAALSRPVTIRRSAMIAAAVVLAAMTGACGSDEESAGGGGKSSGVEKVVVALPGNYIGAAPFYIAQKQGLFKKHDLEVEVTTTNGGPLAIAAVASGSAQFSVNAMGEAFGAIQQGQNIKVASPLTVESQLTCAASPGSEKDLPASDAPWQEKLQALKGKNIGIPSVGGGIGKQFEYIYKAATDGDPTKDVKQIALGVDPGALSAAMKQDRVDVLCHAVPLTELAAEGIGARDYISPGEVAPVAGMVDLAMLTSKKVETERPETLTNFRAALKEGMDFLKANPDEGEEIARQQGFPKFPEEAFKKGWDKLGTDGISYSVEFTPDGFKKARDYASFNTGKDITEGLEDVYAAPAG
jgi:NitT/TauT family transport system substrate-binding protein